MKKIKEFFIALSELYIFIATPIFMIMYAYNGRLFISLLYFVLFMFVILIFHLREINYLLNDYLNLLNKTISEEIKTIFNNVDKIEEEIKKYESEGHSK